MCYEVIQREKTCRAAGQAPGALPRRRGPQRGVPLRRVPALTARRALTAYHQADIPLRAEVDHGHYGAAAEPRHRA